MGSLTSFFMWFRKKTMVFVFGVTNRYTEYQRKLLNGFYPYVSNIFLFQFYFMIFCSLVYHNQYLARIW